MSELKKMKYGGYGEILEEKIEEIDKQAKVIQWYEKENRHNQEIIIKDIKEIERLNKIIKDIKSQLDYLETYSSKEDVFEDMKRRLDRIEKIVNRK